MLIFTVIYIFVVLWYDFIKLMKKGGRTMKKSKILVSTALALCMGATAVTPAFAADNESFTFTKIGDYNADGVASVSDITALQLQLGGNGTISGTALEHIDFDGDGAFNVNMVTEHEKWLPVRNILAIKKQTAHIKTFLCAIMTMTITVTLKAILLNMKQSTHRRITL